MTSSSEKTPEHAHVEELVRTKMPGSPIYAFLLGSVQIVHASKGHVVARLKLTQDHMNSGHSLHGSVSATIVDWMGGMAVATYDLRATTGVSVDIHVTYQSGAKVGDVVEIEGIADRVGRNLAFTKVTIYKCEPESGARGKIVITGTHTKFVKGSEAKATS
jgi:acyl-coenzyme A thioesterase 13